MVPLPNENGDEWLYTGCNIKGVLIKLIQIPSINIKKKVLINVGPEMSCFPRGHLLFFKGILYVSRSN